MTQEQKSIMKDLKRLLYKLLTEAEKDDDFNSLLGNANIFAQSIDDILYKMEEELC